LITVPADGEGDALASKLVSSAASDRQATSSTTTGLGTDRRRR
jgi:hypothetical protein